MLSARPIILSISLLATLSFQAKAHLYIDTAPESRLLECSDIANKSALAFMDHIQHKQLDSARTILTYWETKCGLREPLLRAKFVLAFVENTQPDSLINENTLPYIYSYGHRAESVKTKHYTGYDYNKAYYGFVPLGQEFDIYTKQFFTDQLKNQQPGSLQYVLSEYYGPNAEILYERLQDKRYTNTQIAKEYFKEVNKYKNLPETNIAVLTGIWIPTGGIRLLGNHPLLGFQLGAKYRRWNADLALACKFLRSANTYYARRVNHDDSLLPTSKFFGGYMGIDLSYDLFRINEHETQLLAGFGADGFDALDKDETRNIESESTWTANFNFGLGHRYYLNNEVYIGLQVKYNLVNYAANHVVDFSGNPVTITFVLGWLSNATKAYHLKQLKYDGR